MKKLLVAIVLAFPTAPLLLAYAGSPDFFIDFTLDCNCNQDQIWRARGIYASNICETSTLADPQKLAHVTLPGNGGNPTWVGTLCLYEKGPLLFHVGTRAAWNMIEIDLEQGTDPWTITVYGRRPGNFNRYTVPVWDGSNGQRWGWEHRQFVIDTTGDDTIDYIQIDPSPTHNYVPYIDNLQFTNIIH